MLLGHLDTVWDLGTLAQRPIRIEGDHFYGPGAYDMKGGIVVMVFALKALAARGAIPPVTVFLTPLEEVGCEAYRSIMEADMRLSSAVFDFEPAWPGGAVKTQRKGSASFTLRARGAAAHAGADFARGANAILELSKRLLDAAALTDLARGITVNVGTVRGGTRPNVVPDFAEAEIDVRFRTLADGQSARAALESLRPDDPRVTLEIDGGRLLSASRARAARRGGVPGGARRRERSGAAAPRGGRDGRRLRSVVRRGDGNSDARRPRRGRRRSPRGLGARRPLFSSRPRRPRGGPAARSVARLSRRPRPAARLPVRLAG